MSIRSTLRRSALVASALLAIASAGCDDPLAPGDVAGMYLLRTVDGEPLPFVDARETGVRKVLDVSIVIERDGTALVTQHETFDGVNYSGSVSVAYRLVGDDGFRAESPCPPNALCTPPPHLVGRFRHGRLQLTRLWIDGHEWSFERVHAQLDHRGP